MDETSVASGWKGSKGVVVTSKTPLRLHGAVAPAVATTTACTKVRHAQPDSNNK